MLAVLVLALIVLEMGGVAVVLAVRKVVAAEVSLLLVEVLTGEGILRLVASWIKVKKVVDVVGVFVLVALAFALEVEVM